MYAVVRIDGKFVRVRVAPSESAECAMARAWWIAANVVDKSVHERDCLSYICANEKYTGMKYNISK